MNKVLSPIPVYSIEPLMVKQLRAEAVSQRVKKGAHAAGKCIKLREKQMAVKLARGDMRFVIFVL